MSSQADIGRCYSGTGPKNVGLTLDGQFAKEVRDPSFDSGKSASDGTSSVEYHHRREEGGIQASERQHTWPPVPDKLETHQPGGETAAVDKYWE